MRFEVTLPDLGEDTVSEVTLSAWLVEEGAELNEGDDLLELTTDKAAFTLPCPRSGILVSKSAGEGEVIKVGAALCALQL